MEWRGRPKAIRMDHALHMPVIRWFHGPKSRALS
jgi:hypothetical protein